MRREALSSLGSAGLHAGALLALLRAGSDPSPRPDAAVEVDLAATVSQSPAPEPAAQPGPAPEPPAPEPAPGARPAHARVAPRIARPARADEPPAPEPAAPTEPETGAAARPADDGQLLALAETTFEHRRFTGFSVWRPREPATAASDRRAAAYARGLAAAAAQSHDPRYFGYRGGAPIDLALAGEAPPDRRAGDLPAYPSEALARGIAGAARLRVCTDPSGRVEQIQTQAAPPFLGRAAAAAVMGWRFAPVVRDGGARAACFPVRFEFALGPPRVDFGRATP